MKRKFYTIVLMWMLSWVTGFTQNPIVPPGVYMADPSAHVAEIFGESYSIDWFQFK